MAVELQRCGFGAHVAEQAVITIPTVPPTAEVGGRGLARRQGRRLVVQALGCRELPLAPRLGSGRGHRHIRRIRFPALAACVGRHERLFDILVQAIQDDIGQDGTQPRALWHPTLTWGVRARFQVPRLKEVSHETEKAIIVELLPQDV